MERTKNIFDKIGALIPGYRGYAEREGRRQCDKLLREKIVSMLEQCETTISERIDESIKEKSEKTKVLESNRKYLNTTTSKIKFSPYGTSSFFSNSQIKEPELSEIYKKDLEILEQAVSFKQDLENDNNPNNVEMEIKAIESLLNDRNQFIKEFK